MSDLADRIRTAGEFVDAGYDAQRTEAALDDLHGRLRRRRTRRLALASSIGALCVVAGTLAAMNAWNARRVRTVASEDLFALTDGSVVLPLSPTTRLVAKTVTPRWVEFDLAAGAASFDVVPNPDREFRVSAGRVRVVVVGTQFSVERQGEHATVSVQRGRVRVEWERGQQLLVAGERGSFPPVESGGLSKPSRGDEATDDGATASETNAPQEAPTEAASAAPSMGPRGQPARPAPDWRALAKRGDFPGAHRVLRDKGKPATPMTFDDLLLAADVTRKSGHPAEAPPFLEKALATQVSELRRAVAAFTLGRVRLADLDDPVGAAAAFAQARAAAPEGPLAEDALAREIEAHFRSGDLGEARSLAEEYVKLWPSGAHVRAVRHFGGLP